MNHPVYAKLPHRPALLVLDFDGVFTDNSVYVAEDGKEWVRCCRGDGMGITLLRKAGFPIWVLSTETNPVVQARCKKLKIDCIHGCEDKTVVFEQLLNQLQIPARDTIFVGNDINDVGCLQLAGCGVVVHDAHPTALAVADAILTLAGGRGALREICDLVLEKIRSESLATRFAS
jgi:YrbI family 3-deoxy-D-manno-octulosonate 8-phosphate phosphatase